MTVKNPENLDCRTGSGGWLPLKFFALGLVSLSLVFRIWALASRYFEADELEHLRGAFCVFKGWLPYRDFFEHHNPLIYYLLAPLYSLGENISIIFFSRSLMLLITGVIFLLVFKLARKCFAPVIGWISIIWLCYVFMFFEKSLETRPDLPALACFLLGLWTLFDLSGKRPLTKALTAGFCFSLAFLFTQKIAFSIFGACLVFPVRALIGHRSGDRQFKIKILASILLGFLIPIAITIIYFAARGGLSDLIYRNITMNLAWKRKLPFDFFLKTLAYENPFFVFWAMGGILLTGVQLLIKKDRAKHDLIWFPAILGIVGLFLIPVVLPQTYALAIPLLVMIAAKALTDFLAWIFAGGRLRRIAGSMLLFISGPGLLWRLGGYGGYRPKYIWENPEITLPLFVGLGGAICLLAAGAGNRTARKVFYVLLVFLMIGRPVIFMINYHRLDNRIQLFEMQEILRVTDNRDRVFDTWPIAGFFRLPAYYYHFLHHGLLRMLTPEEKGLDLLAALKLQQPKIISQGINFGHLPPEVRDYISNHYQPCGSSLDLLIRISPGDPALPPEPVPGN